MTLIKPTLVASLLVFSILALEAKPEPRNAEQQAAVDSIDGYKVFKLGATPLELAAHLDARGITAADLDLECLGKVDNTPEANWAGYKVKYVRCDFKKGHLREVKVTVRDQNLDLFKKAWIEKYGPTSSPSPWGGNWQGKTAEVQMLGSGSEMVVTFRNVALDAEISRDKKAAEDQEKAAKQNALKNAKDL